MPEEVRQALKSCLADESGFVELRYHKKTTRSVSIEKGRVEAATIRHREGTGVRVLEDGTFGFSSCGSWQPADVTKAIANARTAARKSAARRKDRIGSLPLVSR